VGWWCWSWFLPLPAAATPGVVIALVVVRAGGLALGRAVYGKDFPARNLRVAREIAGTAAGAGPGGTAG
jgi:hypothetical protein